MCIVKRSAPPEELCLPAYMDLKEEEQLIFLFPFLYVYISFGGVGKMVNREDSIEVITFPCCPKEKLIVFKGSGKGGVSLRCPRCNRYVRFDFERMEGKVFHAIKGATYKENH